MTAEDRLRMLEQKLASLQAMIAGVIPVRLAEAGGSGSATFKGVLATVTVQADKNGGSMGKCSLLNDNLQTTAGEVAFKSAHKFADCKVGMRVWLLSKADIAAGNNWSDAPVWGQLTDVLEYLATRPNFATKKILYVPENGGSADTIDWYSAECPPPQ